MVFQAFQILLHSIIKEQTGNEEVVVAFSFVVCLDITTLH